MFCLLKFSTYVYDRSHSSNIEVYAAQQRAPLNRVLVMRGPFLWKDRQSFTRAIRLLRRHLLVSAAGYCEVFVTVNNGSLCVAVFKRVRCHVNTLVCDNMAVKTSFASIIGVLVDLFDAV